MSTENVHPQVRAIVALLCEGFNVPSSDTRIKAFADLTFITIIIQLI